MLCISRACCVYVQACWCLLLVWQQAVKAWQPAASAADLNMLVYTTQVSAPAAVRDMDLRSQVWPKECAQHAPKVNKGWSDIMVFQLVGDVFEAANRYTVADVNCIRQTCREQMVQQQAAQLPGAAGRFT